MESRLACTCVHAPRNDDFASSIPALVPPTFDEIAFQTRRGEKICEETFFYDPKQMGLGFLDLIHLSPLDLR